MAKKQAPKSSRVKPPSFRQEKKKAAAKKRAARIGAERKAEAGKSQGGKRSPDGLPVRGTAPVRGGAKSPRGLPLRGEGPGRRAAAGEKARLRGSGAEAELPESAAVGGEAGSALPVAEEALDLETPERRVRYEGLPLVVIAGRPNVGKSTLFNRLLHKKRAITDPTPGVTRDPVEAVCEFRASGKRLRLVDTGGFKLEREGLDSLVVEKSLESIKKADLILFLVDAVEITPEDEEFAQMLRRYADKLILVVNKADSPERDALVYAHLRWGFKPMLFISAEHNRNIGELEDAIVAHLDFSSVKKVEFSSDEIRVAIMGKPNTGKSTLLNRLLGEDKSIVSDIAGTTRDVVEGAFEWKKRRIVLLDTAGIRRKKKVTEDVEYYSVNRAIKTVDECDIVILMIDAKEGLTEQDKKITAFAVEKGRGIIFALNKWDEMPDIKNAFEAARDKLRYFFGQVSYAPVLPLSAKEGTGVDKLLNTIVSVHAELCKETETSVLNRAVSAWIDETPPPIGTRTRFKLRYAVQSSVNPLHFIFFVTRPEAVKEAYIAFLRNKIRTELGYDLVPLTVELRASRQAGRDFFGKK